MNLELKPIYILNGEGVDPCFFKETKNMFSRTVDNPVFEIDYSYLLRALEPGGTVVFAGGNGLKQFYSIKQLANKGNKAEDVLRHQLDNKVNFLAVCAGSYAMEFSSLTNMSSLSGMGPENQKIRFREIVTTPMLGKEIKTSVFYFGGPEFNLDGEKLAYFADSRLPAIMETKFNRAKVIMFSHHPEVNADFPFENWKIYTHASTSEEEIVRSLENLGQKIDPITDLCLQRLNLTLKLDENEPGIYGF